MINDHDAQHDCYNVLQNNGIAYDINADCAKNQAHQHNILAACWRFKISEHAEKADQYGNYAQQNAYYVHCYLIKYCD